jgi:hypothetical protein
VQSLRIQQLAHVSGESVAAMNQVLSAIQGDSLEIRFGNEFREPIQTPIYCFPTCVNFQQVSKKSNKIMILSPAHNKAFPLT